MLFFIPAHLETIGTKVLHSGALCAKSNAPHSMRSEATPDTITDEDLLQRAGTGDMRSFEQFYDRLAARAFSLLCQMLRDERVAEEVLRDGFADLWKKAASFDRASQRALPWAVMHLRHHAIERMRVLGRRNRVVDPSSLEQTPPFVEADDVRLEPRAAELASALESLSEDQRQTISRGFSRGLNYHVLSESLGVPPETVKTHVHRGMMRLLELTKGAA